MADSARRERLLGQLAGHGGNVALRPGGLIAIGEAFHSRDFEESSRAHGYALSSKDRINQLDEIVEPIKDSVDEWFFRQNATEEDQIKEITAIVGVFSVRKPGEGASA